MSPRGNDAEAALHELADKFGRGVGNADQLIEASLARSSQALRAAEMLPRHAAATAEQQKKLIGKKVNGETILDVAVRGGTTVAVVEAEDGRRFVIALDEKNKPDVDELPAPDPSTPPMDPHDRRRKNPGQPDPPVGTV
jgi:hypothetical protein